MTGASRRAALIRIGRLFGLLSLLDIASDPLALGAEPSASAAREIPIVAQRFFYTPNVIRLRRGEAVVLAFTSLDFVHGFNAPDFGVRADLLPGRITRVPITPMTAGTFDFLCDNFCGEGHEQMSGQFIVA